MSQTTSRATASEAPSTRVQQSALPRLLGILSPVVHNWSLFALLIGVPSSQISLIEAANPHPSPSYLYNCFNQSLEWWVANHHDPTYEAILAVLDPKWGETTPLMNRNLAKQVKEFMASKQGPTTDLSIFERSNLSKIQGKFAILLEFVRQNLKKKFQEQETADSEVSKLRRFILDNLPHIPERCISSDVEKIFEELRSNKLLTYMNYFLLEEIIKYFGNDNMKTKMEIYKGQLKAFKLAIRIKEYIPECRSRFGCALDEYASEIRPNTTPDYLKNLTITLKESVSEFHLVYIDELWTSVSIILSLPPLAFLLDTIIMGSIIVVWLIPSSLVPKAIEKAQQSAEFFRKHPILKVTIGKTCVFQAEDTEEESVSTEGMHMPSIDELEREGGDETLPTEPTLLPRPQIRHEDRFQAYKTLIHNVAERLGPEDVRSISFNQDLPDIYRRPATALEVLQQLERHGLFSHVKMQPLYDLLKNIHRNDLVNKHVEPYQAKYGRFASFPLYVSRVDEETLTQGRSRSLQEPVGSVRRFHHTPVPLMTVHSSGSASMDSGIGEPSQHRDRWTEEYRQPVQETGELSPQASAVSHGVPHAQETSSNSLQCRRLAHVHATETQFRPRTSHQQVPQYSYTHMRTGDRWTEEAQPFPLPPAQILHPSDSAPTQSLLEGSHGTPHFPASAGAHSRSCSSEQALFQTSQMTSTPAPHGEAVDALGSQMGQLNVSNVAKGSDTASEHFDSEQSQLSSVRLRSGSLPNRFKHWQKSWRAKTQEMQWSLKRNELNKIVYEHKTKKCLSSPDKLELGYADAKTNPKLIFKLYPYGLEEDFGKNATLEVEIKIPAKKCPCLPSSAKVSLTVTAWDCKEERCLNSETVERPMNLRQFTIPKFITHASLRESHSDYIEIQASAELIMEQQ